MKKASLIGIFILASFLFLVMAPAPTSAFEIGARVFVWFPKYGGDLKIDGGSVAGTVINGKDELGLGNEIYPSLEVYGGIGKHHLNVAYMLMDHDGTSTLTRNLVFNGTTYAAGTLINTDMKSKMLDVEYQYDLINLENILAGFSLGLIGKIKYMDFETKLEGQNTHQQSSDSVQLFMPMVGAGAHIGILANLLEARAKISGGGYSSDNLIYETLLELSLTPFPFLDIHGGYRYMKLKIDRSSIFVDSDFSGPYLGLSIGF